MRTKHIIILVAGVLLRCGSNTQKNTEIPQHTDSTYAIARDSSQELKEVEEKIDTITIKEFKEYFKEEERKTYNIFEDTTLRRNFEKSERFWSDKWILTKDSLKRLSLSGYPKSYKRLPSGIIRVTTVGEGENSFQIKLFTLDEDYNTIALDFLTSYGGDEGISSRTFGQFQNDSLYALTEWISGYETDSITEVINRCLVIKGNGEIERIKSCP